MDLKQKFWQHSERSPWSDLDVVYSSSFVKQKLDMEKLEKLMSRDIDGQKLEKFWSLTSFFFFFLKEKGQKNCQALWSDFS